MKSCTDFRVENLLDILPSSREARISFHGLRSIKLSFMIELIADLSAALLSYKVTGASFG